MESIATSGFVPADRPIFYAPGQLVLSWLLAGSNDKGTRVETSAEQSATVIRRPP